LNPSDKEDIQHKKALLLLPRLNVRQQVVSSTYVNFTTICVSHRADQLKSNEPIKNSRNRLDTDKSVSLHNETSGGYGKLTDTQKPRNEFAQVNA
jgi:hypothetical protein